MEDNASLVSEAFSRQSTHFDQLNAENKLTDHLRKKFRKEVLSLLKPGSRILELNGGTGIDAIYFAERNHHVTVTDNAPGMIKQLEKKISQSPLNNKISTKVCSYHDLVSFNGQKFDHIISNFGGLNCTSDLQSVLKQLEPLLDKDGKVTLVIMPKICPWELLIALKGKFSTAFRRLKGRSPANVDGTQFVCYYYNPGYVKRVLKNDFHTTTLKGIFITVPPEFYSNFIERYPKLYRFLDKVDSVIENTFPFTHCCDHYMITLQKKETHH